MNKRLARKANALHGTGVMSAKLSYAAYFLFSSLMLGTLGWCIYSTAGWVVTLILTFIASIPIPLPRLFFWRGNPFNEKISKSASADGGKVAGVAAPTTSAVRN